MEPDYYNDGRSNTLTIILGLAFFAVLCAIAIICAITLSRILPGLGSQPVQPTVGPAPTTPTMVAALQGKRWQWEQRVDQGAVTMITNPVAYVIVFNPDGTFNAIIDCNSASGTYTADELGRIQMQLGPMTTAECGPESRAQDMINMINAVQNYRFEEGGVVLIFVWPANGPLDYYRNAGPA